MNVQSTIPEMPVTATWRHIDRLGGDFPWYWHLRGRCPLCGQMHSHGGGDDPAEPHYGHRQSHCWFGPGVTDSTGYMLVPE